MKSLFILPALLLTLPLQAIAANRLQPFTAEFDLLRGSLELGKTSISLEIEGDSYHYHSRTRPAGIASLIRSDTINESSRGKLLADGSPQPLAYRYLHRKGKQTKRDMRINFDRKAGRVKHRLNDKDPWHLRSVPDNTQDKMSAQLVLMQNALAGRSSTEFTVAAGSKLRQYRYQAEHGEQIDTALGKLQTQRYRRTIKNKSAKMVLWLSAEHNQLPVLIERNDKDSDAVYRLKLTGLTLNGKPIPVVRKPSTDPADVMSWGD